MSKKVIFIAGAIVCLGIATWVFYQYQKPRTRTADSPVAYRISAEQLYTEFDDDEAAANKKYTDKVIEVHGTVGAVQQTEQGTNVLLAAGNATGGVSCNLQGNNHASITTGETIKVRGTCSGFLMDVNLVDGILVTK